MKLYTKAISLILFLLLIPAISYAAPVETVMNTNDAGPGSLRQAIADVDPGGTVNFDPSTLGQAINLTSGSLIIDKDMDIIGLDIIDTTIDGSGIGGIVFDVQPPASAVSISNLSINDNPSTGINISTGTGVFISRVSIVDIVIGVFVERGATFQAADSQIFNSIGSAVFVRGGDSMVTTGGDAVLANMVFLSNFRSIFAEGGAIGAGQGATVSLSDSRIEFGTGTGVLANGGPSDTTTGGTVNITRSIIGSNNIGVLAEKGLNDSAGGGTVNIINSTIFENTVAGVRAEGGTSDSALGGTVDISFSTVAESSTGDGLEVVPDTNGNMGLINVKNSIVAKNGGLNCNADPGDITAEGANFSTTADCNTLDPDFTTVTEMALNMDDTLSAGFVLAINPPSAAIDAATDCTDIDGANVDVDQRTFPRPFGPNCDSGAYEDQPSGSISFQKASIPPGETGFEFFGTGFPDACEMLGIFFLDDNEGEFCIVPAGQFTIEEESIAPGAGVNINCSDAPINQTINSVTLDVSDGENISCTFTNDTRPFILNPIFPAIASNPNLIGAEEATASGPVAFVWAFLEGTTVIGGPTCNGLELDLKNPRLLAIVNALPNGIAEYLFWIPLIGDFELPVLTQAIDVDTCRKSETVLNIIRKE